MLQLNHTLQKHFGYLTFRAGQEKAITALIEGRSAAAIFPTGSGKSLIYQLVAMHLPHLTLVVSPLLALISDQLLAMERHQIPAARIDSTISHHEMIRIREEVRLGKTKVLMVSVERFKNESFRRFLSEIQVSMMVIDEAHCISEWGHNFRPDYIKLPEYRIELNIPQVLLLTATATSAVVEDMRNRFGIEEQDVVSTGFYRSNLHLSVIPASEHEKMAVLSKLLLPTKNESTIVYVTLQKTAEEVAAHLRSCGIIAAAYHAGMNSVDREVIQNGFMEGHTPVIVATIAFGMGIDKSDIRHVVHYDLPKSIEGYSQEIGRAGRDGEISRCTLLGSLDGVNVLENFVYGDTPELSSIVQVLEDIQLADGVWEVQMNRLSTKVNIRQLPLKTLLVYLEMDKVIKPIYSYFSSYRYKNVLSEGDILARFKGERRQFLEAIFNYSSKARLWTTVDFGNIAKHYSTDRHRIAAALDYLNEQGLIVLETKLMIEAFEVVQKDIDIEKVAEKTYQKFALREGAEVNRIKEMIAFFGGDKCLSKSLSEYFGEVTNWELCGHCSVCISGVAKLVKSIHLPELNQEMVNDLLAAFRNKLPIEKSSPVLSTRFLCGIHTPLFSSIKASSMHGYGALADYRFEEVMKWVK